MTMIAAVASRGAAATTALVAARQPLQQQRRTLIDWMVHYPDRVSF